MATVTYQQFYYLPDDEFIELEDLNAYFEHHQNYDLYKDEMYCPECLQCKLEYTPENDSLDNSKQVTNLFC